MAHIWNLLKALYEKLKGFVTQWFQNLGKTSLFSFVMALIVGLLVAIITLGGRDLLDALQLGALKNDPTFLAVSRITLEVMVALFAVLVVVSLVSAILLLISEAMVKGKSFAVERRRQGLLKALYDARTRTVEWMTQQAQANPQKATEVIGVASQLMEAINDVQTAVDDPGLLGQRQINAASTPQKALPPGSVDPPADNKSE